MAPAAVVGAAMASYSTQAAQRLAARAIPSQAAVVQAVAPVAVPCSMHDPSSWSAVAAWLAV